MKCAQPCARKLLVTVAVPANAAVFGMMRCKIGDGVERGIGVFSKLLHVLITRGLQISGERFPFIRNFPVYRNVLWFVDMQDALEQRQKIGARHGTFTQDIHLVVKNGLNLFKTRMIDLKSDLPADVPGQMRILETDDGIGNNHAVFADLAV